ncbi:MAG: PLP-dependent aminotransferase family protein [Succinivibrio sp.]|nr:PLP-dependent aminotransferase family protein [Succinivibrio sp.]
MLTYVLEKKRSEALYENLGENLRRDILSGVLKPGERLPSKRAFARNLGISVITVENAYLALEDEGLIVSRPRSGFFVAEATERRKQAVPQSAPERIDLPVPSGEKLIADFSSSGNTPESFPFGAWSRIMRTLLSTGRRQLLEPPPSGGALVLREALCAHLRDFHGMQVSPGQIIVGAGTEYLCGLIVRLLGTELLYGTENPGYGSFAAVCRSYGVRTAPLGLDEDGLKPEELERAGCDAVHVSPARQFPTGAVMPLSRRYALLSWAAAKAGRFVIEDDYESDLRIGGRPLPPLQSADVSGRVIYVSTFTKTLASTVRISYMVLPADLAKRFYEKLSFCQSTVPALEQYTLARFIESGGYEKHLIRLRGALKARRDQLLALISQGPLKGLCTVAGSDAGLHLLLRLQRHPDPQKVCAKALELGVRIRPLADFYTGAAPEDASRVFVLNYSAVPSEALPQAAKALNVAFAI